MRSRILLCLALSALISSGAAFAESAVKQIAGNASSTFFSVYREGGMSPAIERIKACYDGAKTADAYIFCLAMDTQARRIERSLSERSNAPMHAYFNDDAFEARLQLLERWYPRVTQLDYAKNQMMDGLEAGIKAEVALIEQK